MPLNSEYSDRDGLRLLEHLVRYAEHFKADHSDPELSVKELVEDLVDTMGPSALALAEEYKDRIYDGLNNVDHGASDAG